MIYSARIVSIDKALDGSPMFTAITSSGALFSPCFLLSHAAGLDGMLSNVPIKIHSAVCLLRVDESTPCFIIGGFADETAQSSLSIENPVTADADEDYTGRHIDEHITANGSTTLTLSPRNNFVVNTPSAKIQLGGGKLRVSQDGEANNEVLNAAPFIDVLFDYLAELELRVAALTASVNALNQVLTEKTPTGASATQRITVEIPAEIAIAQNANDLVTVAALQRELAALTAQQTAQVGVNTPLSPVTIVRSGAEDTTNDHIQIP